MGHQPAQKPEMSALAEGFLNFVSGTAAGMVGKTAEFPLDSIKVRLQSQPGRYKNAIDCFSTMLKTEGVISFYRGLPSPLVGCMFENACVFSAYNFARRVLKPLLPEQTMKSEVLLVSAPAALAGFVAALINTPVELIKCRMQAQPHLYKNSFECLRKSIRESGVRVLTKGFLMTVGREVPGTVVWFGGYEGFLRWRCQPGQSPRDLPLYNNLIAGALGGLLYWTVPFPFDVVKSQVQTYAGGQRYSQVVREIYKVYGLRGFYSGLLITVARAVPANALIFATYETVYRAVGAVLKEK